MSQDPVPPLPSSDVSTPKAIMAAAFGVFVQYGYKRTSMEDIAQAAQMSRPALYLHFRNKEDIYRRMVAAHFSAHVEGVSAALAGAGSPASRLEAALLSTLGPVTEVLLTSPHGAELLDAGTQVGGDTVAQGNAALQRVYADWVRAEQAVGRIDPQQDADLIGWTIVLGALGLKQPPYGCYRDRLICLAQVIGAGLSAARPSAAPLP
ncbi:MAG: TetR/AcrR family transcriptional regulator [Paracoccaceae bacterium]